MRLRRILLRLSLAYVVMAVLAAQTPDEPDWQKAAGGKVAFDVASVRLAKSPRFPSLPLFDRGDGKPPGGRFSASFSLPIYIYFAYKLDAFQAKEMNSQLSKWQHDDYAIDAEAEDNPTKDQMRLMMQSLLADRFKLRVHFESREVPVLALTLAKPGKLGPKLLPHSEGPPCPESFEMDKPFTPSPPPKRGAPPGAWPRQCGTLGSQGTSDGTWIGSRNTTMALLAQDITNAGLGFGEIDKPIVDQTGLEGRFDFLLELPAGMLTLGPRIPNPDDPPKGTPFLNALREQLGLKLERSRGEVRTLIIDHVERPSEN